MQPYLAIATPLANGGLLVSPVNTAAHPEHPIAPGGEPPHVAHPIAPGGKPPSVWPSPGHPAHPIVIPPDGPPPGEQPPTGPLGKLEWQTVWTEEYGWAVVGVLTDPHPTPSAQGPAKR